MAVVEAGHHCSAAAVDDLCIAAQRQNILVFAHGAEDTILCV